MVQWVLQAQMEDRFVYFELSIILCKDGYLNPTQEHNLVFTQAFHDLVFSRRCQDEDSKEMYQDAKRA